MSSSIRPLNIGRAYRELCEIDNYFNDHDINIEHHHFNSIEEASSYVDTLTNEKDIMVYLLAMINHYMIVYKTVDTWKKIFTKYKKQIAWFYSKNVSFLDSMIRSVEHRYGVDATDIQIEMLKKPEKVIELLNDVKIDNKLEIIKQFMNSSDSKNTILLKKLPKIAGFEKLYHDGTLRLTDEAYSIFDNKTIHKINNP